MFYHTHVYTHLTIPPNPFLSLNLHLPVGSSLKKCHVALSPLHTQTVPLATRDIAHSTRGRILSGRRSTFSGYLTSGILSGRRSTFSGYLTSGILSRRHSTFSGYLTSGILSSQRSTFSGYLTSGIMSGRHSTFFGYSHPVPDAGWERRAIQLPRSDMSGSSDSAYPESIRSRQFRFPGQLGSSDTHDYFVFNC